jgi:hypothetical protein
MSSLKKDFNKNHPERKPDEVFITNASDQIDDFPEIIGNDGRSSWDHIGWKTKRKGQIAYDIDGNPLGNRWPEAFPVFAKQSEINKEDPKITERLLP